MTIVYTLSTVYFPKSKLLSGEPLLGGVLAETLIGAAQMNSLENSQFYFRVDGSSNGSIGSHLQPSLKAPSHPQRAFIG